MANVYEFIWQYFSGSKIYFDMRGKFQYKDHDLTLDFGN